MNEPVAVLAFAFSHPEQPKNAIDGNGQDMHQHSSPDPISIHDDPLPHTFAAVNQFEQERRGQTHCSANRLERVMRRLELARRRAVQAGPFDARSAFWVNTWNDAQVELMLRVDWQARRNHVITLPGVITW